ncbi:plastocyanin [Inhella inkyongensis]|uniref:Plastocyanin n=1 Tax=Inhella inkyongensis TaxID=392593 RepID=A0A840S935_9BURK|nr:plastocyanin [Inhella inkyongensis]MBB5206122.1 plastocyanin [Inhella inkyongensis]
MHAARKSVLALLIAGLTQSAALAADVTVQVLDREGKALAGAVVVLETSVSGPRPTPLAEHTIEQEQMRFAPAVSVVHLSTKVHFVNLDRWDHHVRGGAAGPGGVYLDASQGFAFRLSGRVAGKPASRESRQFNQTGPQLLGCHLHGSMRGHLYVTDSPWAAVSDAQGQVQLREVPAGGARLRVWHAEELVETPPQALSVSDGMAAVRVATQVVVGRKKKPVEGGGYGY